MVRSSMRCLPEVPIFNTRVNPLSIGVEEGTIRNDILLETLTS